MKFRMQPMRRRQVLPALSFLLAGAALAGPGCAPDRAGETQPASAAEVSGEVDAAALAALHERLRTGDIANVHGVIILQDGAVVAEWYFAGEDERRGQPLGAVAFDADTPHDIRSVTKSVVAILAGIAVDSGAIASLDTPVLDYFPEHVDLRTSERLAITLRHALTMTSGLRWDEETYPYTDPRNSETAMDHADDPFRHTLSQPIEAQAGARWTYSGGDVALMAEAIARATGEPVEAFAERALFAPLGIEGAEWLKDARGVPYAASGLRMRPRDMAKIGELVRRGGVHDGRRIVSADWIADSLAPHASTEDDEECPTRYGYYWWLAPDCAGVAPWIAAIGNGGQRIIIAPDRNAVIVVTAGLYNDRRQSLIREVTAMALAALPAAE